MDENTQQKLEGCLLGYVTRRKLVYWLRKDYERVVSEIQAPTERDGHPLANEVLVWPKEDILCLPRFITQFNEGTTSLSDDNSNTHQSLEDPLLTSQPSENKDDRDTNISIAEEADPRDTNISIAEETDHRNTNISTTEEADCRDTNISIAEAIVLPELPESKEGLLELRAQLSMELLWVKQAIASRQEYLVYKMQLTSNR